VNSGLNDESFPTVEVRPTRGYALAIRDRDDHDLVLVDWEGRTTFADDLTRDKVEALEPIQRALTLALLAAGEKKA